MLHTYVAIFMTVITVIVMLCRCEYGNVERSYHHTVIVVCNNNENGNETPITERNNVTCGQFMIKYILDDLYCDPANVAMNDVLNDKPFTYSDFILIYKRAFDRILENISVIGNKKFASRMFCSLFDKNLCVREEMATDDVKSDQLVVFDKRLLKFRKQLQCAMLDTLKEMSQHNNSFAQALGAIIDGTKNFSYTDKSFDKSHANNGCRKIRYDLVVPMGKRNEELTNSLDTLSQRVKRNDVNHCRLDLTDICFDELPKLIFKIKDEVELEQRKIIKQNEKNATRIAKEAITDTLTRLSKMKYSKHQRFTIGFDIILILEFAVMSNCSKHDFKLISASLKNTLNSIFTIVNGLKEEHGNFTVEVLGINDLIKLKLYSHTSTPGMFDRIEEHIKTNTSADPDKIAEVRKLINFVKPSRWIFDGSLFDSLVGTDNDTLAASDVDALLTFYNEKSRLIIDTCSVCNEKKEDFCVNCRRLKCHFGHICILYKHYKDLLERKTQLYYYQSMDDLDKYGKDDDFNALKKSTEKSTFYCVSDSTTANAEGSNSPVKLSETDGKTHQQLNPSVTQAGGSGEYRNQVKKEEKEKLLRDEVIRHNKLLRQEKRRLAAAKKKKS